MSRILKSIAVGVLLLCGIPVSSVLAQSGSAITTDGIADNRVDMTQRQVAHLLKPGSNGNNCWISRSGLTVVMDRGIVVLVQTESPQLATLSGARVGMTERALRSLYPGRLELPNFGYRRLYYYSSSGNAISFAINEEKSTDITAGKRWIITYDEYCA